MTSRELAKLLQSKGCWLERSGKGSHQVWRCPGACQTVLPAHRGDIPQGTLRAIFKALESLSRQGMVEVMAKRTYVARYERDENDYWAVTLQVGPKKAAISDGQTLEKARRRIRQAVAVLLDVAEDTFEIQDDVRLPAGVRKALGAYESAEATARQKNEELDLARRKAARALDGHGLSRRDSGDLLGLSGQRIQQLVGERRRA